VVGHRHCAAHLLQIHDYLFVKFKDVFFNDMASADGSITTPEIWAFSTSGANPFPPSGELASFLDPPVSGRLSVHVVNSRVHAAVALPQA
jgi:hypothetical protein